MPKFDRTRLRQWAITGAEQRLLEIATEAAAIHRAFPELRERKAATGTGRRKLSAAARKRISAAQKKRWAAHRRAAR